MASATGSRRCSRRSSERMAIFQTVAVGCGHSSRIDTTLLGVPVRIDANRQAVVSTTLVRLARSRPGCPEFRAVQSVPAVGQSIGGLVPAAWPTDGGRPAVARPRRRGRSRSARDRPREPRVARRGREAAGPQPATHEQRGDLGVDRQRGAGGPGPRPPAIGQSHDDQSRSARPHERRWRGLDDQRLGRDTEPPLHRERCARQQPARVAPLGAGARAGELQTAPRRARARRPARPPPSRARNRRTARGSAPARGGARRRGSRHRRAPRRATRAGGRPPAGRRARRRPAARRPARPPAARGHRRERAT